MAEKDEVQMFIDHVIWYAQEVWQSRLCCTTRYTTRLLASV